MSDVNPPDDEDPTTATPVAPAPASEAPSSTGLIDGDANDVTTAPPSPDEGE